MNPIRNPPANLKGNPGSNPVIKMVIVRVIVKSIASVMNNANNTVEYFLSIFIRLTRACYNLFILLLTLFSLKYVSTICNVKLEIARAPLTQFLAYFGIAEKGGFNVT
jgi:hypothetical protein